MDNIISDEGYETNKIDVDYTCVKVQCSSLCSSAFKFSALEISSTPKATTLVSTLMMTNP